jgi:hypothetical protein
MNFNFSSRDTKAKQIGDGDAPTFEVGQYIVTRHADGSLTYKDRWRQPSTDPRHTLPNLSITDGKMEILIEDLVDTMLTRIEPVELAHGLWTNEDVRAEFIEVFVLTYLNEFTDGERRKFLTKVKEVVHSTEIGQLISTMTNMEHDFAKKFNSFRYVDAVNRALIDLDVRREDGTLLQMKHPDYDPEFSIGGKAWNEALAFWRGAIVSRFPSPQDDEQEPGQ